MRYKCKCKSRKTQKALLTISALYHALLYVINFGNKLTVNQSIFACVNSKMKRRK